MLKKVINMKSCDLLENIVVTTTEYKIKDDVDLFISHKNFEDFKQALGRFAVYKNNAIFLKGFYYGNGYVRGSDKITDDIIIVEPRLGVEL